MSLGQPAPPNHGDQDMRTKLTFTRHVRITRKTAQRLRVLATEIEVAIALLKIDAAVASIVTASQEG